MPDASAFTAFYYSPSADCLIAEVVNGPKRYARLFGSAFDHVEWGWVLPDDAERLTVNDESARSLPGEGSERAE